MAYTDLTTTFTYNRKCIATEFNALAVNALDAYNALNAPMFSAYASASMNTGALTWTKVQFNTEEWDSHGNFDTANYRFTPTVAGKYHIVTAVTYNGAVANAEAWGLQCYKNGTGFKLLNYNAVASKEMTMSGGWVVSANGSSDYFEIFVLASIDRALSGGATKNFFQGRRLCSVN